MQLFPVACNLKERNMTRTLNMAFKLFVGAFTGIALLTSRVISAPITVPKGIFAG
jgi:hypothetical protein